MLTSFSTALAVSGFLVGSCTSVCVCVCLYQGKHHIMEGTGLFRSWTLLHIVGGNQDGSLG